MKKYSKIYTRNKLIKQIFQLLTVYVFVSFIIIVGILFFLLPKSGYSEIEKRDLKKIPSFSLKSVADGSYTDDLTTYVSDNFAFRDKLVNLSKVLEENRGVNYNGMISYAGSNTGTEQTIKCIDTPLKNVKKTNSIMNVFRLGEEKNVVINVEDIIDNNDIYDELDEEEVKGQQVGSIYVIEEKNTALEIFYGNSDVAQDYVDIINTYCLYMNPSVTVYDMVVPTHFEFGMPKKYKAEIGNDQKPIIDEIYESLNPSVKSVDAYSNIEKHYKQKEYLYFRTDHHWTALGAYRAYEAFAKTAGFEPTPLSEFEPKKIDEFLGTFYANAQHTSLQKNPDYIDYYAPKNECKVTNHIVKKDGTVSQQSGFVVANRVSDITQGYLVFLGGDIPLSVIETDAGTGRSIIVFKESYGNALIPFLTSNFDKIYVADIRTFPYNAVNFVLNNPEITDVLFLNNIMTSCSPPRIKNYLNLLSL